MTADAHGETRRLPPEGGRPARSSRGWRTDQSGHSIRAQRLKRRLQIGLVTLSLCVIGGVVVWVILCLRNIPPTKFVAIGLSHYPLKTIPPNIYGSEDCRYLHDVFAEVASVQKYDAVYAPKIWDNRLNLEVLLEGGQFSDLSGRRGNLFVYISLHGRVEPGNGEPGTGAAQLLGSRGERISVPTLLRRMHEESQAENILVLFDVGRLLPNWRMGILANDFPTQLAEDVKQSGFENLHVICSCEAGEYSWPQYKVGSPEDDAPTEDAENNGEATKDSETHSRFAYYVVEALRGAADGHPTNNSSDAKDSRVTNTELIAYVRNKIGESSDVETGVEQTVWDVFGDQEFNFPIVAVDSKSSAPSRDDEPTDSDANESKADDEPASGDAKEPIADDEAPTPEERLAGLFVRRDKSWKDSRDTIPVETYAPHAWNRLQCHLVRAEQQVRGGLEKQALETIQEIENLFTQIEQSLQPQGAAELATLSLALAEQLTSVEYSKWEGADEFLTLLRDADDRLELMDDGKEADKLLGELQKKFLDDPEKGPAARLQLMRWLLKQAGDDCSQVRLPQLRRIVNLLGSPRDFPTELVLLHRLMLLADDRQIEWSNEWKGLCEQALSVRSRAEQLIAAHHEAYPFLAPALIPALRHLQAGERWLLAGDPQHAAAAQFDRASALLDEALGKEPVSSAIRQANSLWADLPVHARHQAFRLEANNLTVDDLEELLRLGQLVRTEQAQLGSGLKKLGVDERLLPSFRWLGDWSRESQRSLGRSVEGDKLEELVQRRDSELNLGWIIGNGENWRTIEESLQLPKIEADSRRELKKFNIGTGSGVKNRSPESHAGRGIWHGFWAIQVLQLAAVDGETREHLDIDGLWDAWQKLVEHSIDISKKQDSDGEPEPVSEPSKTDDALLLAHDRARLGDLIEDAWKSLSELVEDHLGDESLAHAPLVRVLDGMDKRGEPDELVQARRDRNLRDWLHVHAQRTWMPFFGEHDGYEGLIERLEQAYGWRKQDREQEFGSPVRLAPLELEQLVINVETEFRVPIARTVANAAQQFQVQVLAARDVTVTQNGKPVRDPLTVPAGDDEIIVGVKAKAGIPRQQLTVVLLDETGEFPLDVQLVPLDPPFDPNGWGVKLIARQQPSAMESTNLKDELNLPAFSEEPIPFDLVLVRPANDVTAKVTVTAYGIGQEGREALIGAAKDFEIPPEREANLTLQQASDPGAGDRADPDAKVDASQGLLFKIKPEGRETINFTLLPVFWRATTFIDGDQTKVAFRDGKVSVEVHRKPEGVPVAKFPVELVLPDDVAVAQGIPIGELNEERPLLPLSATLAEDEQDVFSKRPLPISLTIAGLPRAFRWNVRQGGQADVIKEPYVRIVVLEPPRRNANVEALLTKGEPLRVAFQVDGGNDRAATLQWEMLQDGERHGGRLDIPFRLRKHVLVDLAPDGALQFSTEAKDYEQEIPVQGKTGKFVLTARLLQNGIERASDSIDVAIDDTAPLVKQPVFRLRGGKKPNEHDIRQALEVQLAASDDLSGIEEIVFGIDRDGKDGLAENEILERVSRPQGVTVPVTIAPEKLPPEGSRQNFVAEATNGVGLRSRVESKPIQFFKSPEPPPPAAPPGELVVQIHQDYRLEDYAVELKAKDGKTYTKQIPRGQGSCVFEVPAGTYDLKVDGRRRDYSDSGIEVVADKRATLPPIKPILQ